MTSQTVPSAPAKYLRSVAWYFRIPLPTPILHHSPNLRALSGALRGTTLVVCFKSEPTNRNTAVSRLKRSHEASHHDHRRSFTAEAHATEKSENASPRMNADLSGSRARAKGRDGRARMPAPLFILRS